MTKILLNTSINAPINMVFDAARNIDLHMNSAEKTKEKAIAGTVSGVIKLYETVTWKGKHFGMYLKHQSKITSIRYPTFFVDKMIQGHFVRFKHQHIFRKTSTGTEMIDVLEYQTPYSIFGKIFDRLVLKRYLVKFLLTRNRFLKRHTENRARF
ncbi:SRPBCC family protein [Aquimarina sp. 2201CG14-23]|uniref:SRPBCC family protein n=1 Tax=Aquimarina mycalae TaxID=3040073 RepID=UPI0024780078|nr:SRPBCC family protein [Aquimarina sp. 2201CG14-23]MDH7444831.1 SRPBCC family protein [Aquimarina sp. 2201CG14-23]